MSAVRKKVYAMPAVEVGFWLGSLRYLPDVAEIRNHTGCSRAMAYRWLAFAKRGGRGHVAPLPLKVRT